MRRRDREITDFDAIMDIISRCDILRLGLIDQNMPYVVPVNFSYTACDQKLFLYIHGAMAGRKYELMQKTRVCSFEMDNPLKIECVGNDITMRYECVMGTAIVEFLEGPAKEKVMEDIILHRYESLRGFQYNKNLLNKTAIVKLSVLDLSAKVNPISGGAD